MARDVRSTPRTLQRNREAAVLASRGREAIEDFALRDDYALNPQYVQMVIDAADRGATARVRELVEALKPEDVADLIGFVPPALRQELIEDLPRELLVEVLPELDDQIREDVLDDVEPARIAEAVADLDTDDAAAVLEDLEEDQLAAVLAAMPAEERAAVETALSYEENTAGRLMQREVLAAPQFWTVGQTIDHARGDAELPERFFDVYVVDPAYKPVGAVPLSALMRAKRDTPLSDLMEPVTEVGVEQDQEEVAYVFEKYNLISAPVTDDSGRLIGQITIDDVVTVVQEEGQEDILALAGVGEVGRDAGVVGMSRSRVPWLAVNLLTAMLGAGVISLFEATIQQIVVLAVLLPIVSAIGGNAGTQSLTVTVRALAMRELNAANALRTFWRELTVGLLNGFVLAPLLGVAAGFFAGDWRIGAVIASAMVLNLLVAATVGMLTPLTLSRLKQDPAVSSAVFVTACTDFFGFLIFLGLATLVLL